MLGLCAATWIISEPQNILINMSEKISVTFYKYLFCRGLGHNI